jgi:hypothetical protein
MSVALNCLSPPPPTHFPSCLTSSSALQFEVVGSSRTSVTKLHGGIMQKTVTQNMCEKLCDLYMSARTKSSFYLTTVICPQGYCTAHVGSQLIGLQ